MIDNSFVSFLYKLALLVLLLWTFLLGNCPLVSFKYILFQKFINPVSQAKERLHENTILHNLTSIFLILIQFSSMYVVSTR